MDSKTIHCREPLSFTIVCDERCFVVNRLAALLKLWDRSQLFTFVDRESVSETARQLIQDLDASPWSLYLIDDNDDNNERWYGPEAIPMILKNLRFGRFVAVLYILPGTMWLTRQIYQLISRTRLIISNQTT